jgi:hypothetical protein
MIYYRSCYGYYIHWTTFYMFMYQYIKETVQSNSNAVAVPDRGVFQLLLVSHPQYVHLV